MGFFTQESPVTGLSYGQIGLFVLFLAAVWGAAASVEALVHRETTI